MPNPIAPIPGRRTVLLSSVVFCLASALLLLQFVGLTLHACSLDIVNGLGAASCLCWFVGFALFIEWLVFHSFAAYGPSRRALVGATLKLIASVLFCVQPFSGLARRHAEPLETATLAKFNFVGISFFHAGNCIDAVGMAPLLERSRLLSHANAPVYGMLLYCAASWLLIAADGLLYYAVERPTLISAGQIAGAGLLLCGSLVYTGWAIASPAPRRPLAALAALSALTEDYPDTGYVVNLPV